MGCVFLLESPSPAPPVLAAERDRWRERLHRTAGEMGPSDCLWLASTNGYHEGELLPWGYELAAVAGEAGLLLKNVYVRFAPLETPPGKPLASAHELVFFLVKSLRDYAFDKTPLREPHIYKDVEWGKRTVGVTGYHDASRKSARYPEGGRDPGNVLYRDRRGDEAQLLDVLEYPRLDLFRRLVQASSREGWVVRTNVPDAALHKDLEALGRVVKEEP